MTSVSVIVPSYNHARYLEEAIYSVLHQTVPVKEVLVVDDASSDDSLKRVAHLSDSRIRVFPSSLNLGGAETLNRGIAEAKGELIAICNSDDTWEPAKIERQLEILASMPEVGAVFSNVRWINENSQEFGSNLGFGKVFQQPNRSRHLWIRDLFERGNCLCHPSVLVRRSLYEQIGLYDNRLRQLPDYKMWLALLRKSQIHVLSEQLVRFRIHDNTSKSGASTSTCNRNEFSDIALDFLNKLDVDNFVGAFGSRKLLNDDAFNLPVEKILYLWSRSGLDPRLTHWMAGDMAMNLLATETGRKSWSGYGLSLPDFHTLRGLQSPWARLRRASTYTPTELFVLQKIGFDVASLSSSNSMKHENVTSPADATPTTNVDVEEQPSRILRTAGLFLMASFRHPFSRKKRRSHMTLRARRPPLR